MAKRPQRVINRPKAIDPFLDLIRLLRPQATLWGAIRANGRWGVGFRERHDLLFFRVDCGQLLLLRSNEEPLRVGPGDLLLIRTLAPFVLASDRRAESVDSETLVATTRSTTMRVGSGKTRASHHSRWPFCFRDIERRSATSAAPSFGACRFERDHVRAHSGSTLDERSGKSCARAGKRFHRGAPYGAIACGTAPERGFHHSTNEDWNASGPC